MHEVEDIIATDYKVAIYNQKCVLDNSSDKISVNYLNNKLHIDILATIEQPIYVVSMGYEQGVHNQENYFTIAKGAKVNIIEHYHGNNHVNTVFNCQDDTEVKHCLVQKGKNITDVNLGENVKFKSSIFSIQNNQTEIDFNANFNQINSQIEINSLEYTEKQQAHKINVNINHNVPHCSSKVVARAVLKDQAQASFIGKINIKPDAIKSDTDMQIKSLLLSNDANMHARPQLEIYNDDVKASHGATIGQLDKDAIFYLNQRGIPKQQAIAILIASFIEIILKTVDFEIRIM